jgi:hypothetical protein
MSRSRSCFGRKKFQGRMKVRIGQLETAWGQFGSALGRRRDQNPQIISMIRRGKDPY